MKLTEEQLQELEEILEKCKDKDNDKCFHYAENGIEKQGILKGALWSLFIPVLFVGKMKFFMRTNFERE